MGEHVIEFDCECESCQGTGVYAGMAERYGTAVVCYSCRGTGKVHRKITYRDFEGRRKIDSVKWVVLANPGFVIGYGSDFGGMAYDKWFAGVPFPRGSEMRKLTCPAWWFQTTDQDDKKPNWNTGGMVCQSAGKAFTDCKHFHKKELCWARWDQENPKDAAEAYRWKQNPAQPGRERKRS